MTETDEYFPRGKVAPAVKKAQSSGDPVPSVKRKASNGVVNLFKNKNTEKQKLPGGKFSKGKKSKHALTPEEEKALRGKRNSQQEKRFAVVPLNYDQIVEGMLSLAIITKIRDHEIYVNMPGRTSGYVSIMDISTPYIKILESHAAGTETTDEEEAPIIYPLREMFHVGQCVVVKVKSVQSVNSKLKIGLSMNPKDIYANYNTTVLKEDLLMVAAVSSVEDHGYQMDVGINGARCFLPKEDANKFIQHQNHNKPLGIGQLLYCKINKIQFHRLIANVGLTTYVKGIRAQKMDEVIGLNYSTLIPGMLVDGIVMETHGTGLMAYCLELNGLVHQDHMDNEWVSPESLEIGSTAAARILYILPNLTTPYLTMQTNLLPMSVHRDRNDKNGLLGSKQHVKVVRVEKRGIIIRLQVDGSKGIIPVSHIGDDTLLTVDDIKKKYKENSMHECRVLHQSPVERMYLCSFRKDKMENDLVHTAQAIPGTKVSCKILRWNNGGAIVQFGSGVNGFIPNPLYRPEKLTEAAKDKLIGTIHKARIVKRESEKDKIILTARKELVTSKGAVISSLKEAEPGMTGHAIIKHCGQAAVFVMTIGGVEGFIPATKLSTIRLPDVRETFRPGQILPYKVLEKIKNRHQLLMTAIFDSESDSEENDSQVQENRKAKKRQRNSSETDSEVATKSKKRKGKNKKIPDTDEDDEDSFPDEEPEEVETELKLPESGSFWDTSLPIKTEVESDTELDSVPTKTKKQKKQEKEAQETEAEETQIDPPEDISSEDANTTMADDSLELAMKYENGVISSPDDPFYWTKLMSHYTSVGNIEKARSISKQALDMISYRNEKGKLKVWGALFNLEVKYGTADTLKAVFADALQRNDHFECQKVMAVVYDNANRIKDAERIYRQMVKEFRLEPSAWIRFGTFYFLRKKSDPGRALLNEALTAVPANKQVFLITQFALLELHHGEQNRGESMLDRVLNQYPNRSDIWLLYVNALVKLGDYERARNVFRKALQVSWNPRKVKPLLKRFHQFESAHGNEETLKAFQELALKVLNVSSTD